MAVIPVDSWPNRLRARVYEQFKESNWAYPLADTIGAGADQLELAFRAMLLLFSIEAVTSDATSPLYGVGRGVQLDRIGRLVGQPRAGADDDHYRFYLRARIRANRSCGTPGDVIAVFQAMFTPAATQQPLYAPGGNASMELHLLNPTSAAEAEIARLFLGDSVLAGVRALLYTQEFEDEAMFFTALASYVNSIVSPGDATIDVVDASSFPTTGSIVVDQGTPNEETLVYSGRSGTTFYIPATAANAHTNGAAVCLVGSPGLGFPIATYVNAPAAPTDTAFDVVDSAAFSTDDVIVVDEGLAVEETFTVTGVILGAIAVTPAIAHAHATGAAIVLIGSGGSLARAHEA